MQAKHGMRVQLRMQINRYFDLKVKADPDCWHNALNKLYDVI